MVDHRTMDIDKIKQYSEYIATIDNIYIPDVITDFLDLPKNLMDKMYENQEEFLIDYRYEKYWKKGETRYEMDQRLIREFVEAYPELEMLCPKSGVTVEEHQKKLMDKFPEDIQYAYTPK